MEKQGLIHKHRKGVKIMRWGIPKSGTDFLGPRFLSRINSTWARVKTIGGLLAPICILPETIHMIYLFE